MDSCILETIQACHYPYYDRGVHQITLYLEKLIYVYLTLLVSDIKFYT